METRFEFRDFIKVFALSILLYAGFTTLFIYFPGADEFLSSVHPTVSFLLTYLIQFVILFFPLWIFVIDKYSASFKDFGFEKIKIGKLLKNVLGFYVLYFVIAAVLAMLFDSTGLQIPGYEAQESYIPLFGDDALGFTSAFVLIVIVAPFLEEFFFRGFVYKVLTKTWSVPVGSLITAGLFALIHFQIQSFFPILILGLFLNIIYQRTNSLWAAIAFHALNNALAFGFDVYLHLHPELLEQMQEKLEMASGLL